jgi:hypothetical protein
MNPARLCDANRAAGDLPRKAKDLHIRSETGPGTITNNKMQNTSNTKTKVDGLAIPGAPGYTLTKDFKVYGRRGFIIKAYTYAGYTGYGLYASERRMFCSLARIAYAVYKNVDIQALPRDYVIKFKDDKPGNDFIIRTRESHMHGMRLRHAMYTAESTVDYYNRCHRFSGLVIRRDAKGIYSFMEEYKEMIINDLLRHMSYNTAIRVYKDIINEFVLGILEGRFHTPDPVSYIRKYARATYTLHLTPRNTPPLFHRGLNRKIQ